MNLQNYRESLELDLKGIADVLNSLRANSMDDIEEYIYLNDIPVTMDYWDCENFENIHDYLDFNYDSDLVDYIMDFDIPFIYLNHTFRLSDQPCYYSKVNLIIYPREEDVLKFYMRELKIDRIKKIKKGNRAA